MLTVHSAHMLTAKASGTSGFKLPFKLFHASAFAQLPQHGVRFLPDLPGSHLFLETQLQLHLLQEVFSDPVAPSVQLCCGV